MFSFGLTLIQPLSYVLVDQPYRSALNDLKSIDPKAGEASSGNQVSTWENLKSTAELIEKNPKKFMNAIATLTGVLIANVLIALFVSWISWRLMKLIIAEIFTLRSQKLMLSAGGVALVSNRVFPQEICQKSPVERSSLLFGEPGTIG